MKHRVDFSIIIPTYNRADILPLAVNSLLQQGHKSFEVIVVDDGSTDNTEEVVAHIKDERVKYFKKENEERSIARNYGIEKAQGKYVGFLDADDYVLPNHLEVAYQYLLSKGFPEIIHSGYKIENENNETLLIINDLDKSSIENLVYDNTFHCNAIFIKSDIIKKYHFINDKYATIAEDMYLWIVLASRYIIHFYNEITVVVVEHNDRSLNNLNPKKVKKSFDIILKTLVKDEMVKERYGKGLKIMAGNQYLFCANLALDKKEYGLFIQCIVESIKSSPKMILTRLLKKLSR